MPAAPPPVALFDNYWATTLAFVRSLGRHRIPVHVYGAGAGRWSRFCARRLRGPPIEQADEFEPWLAEQLRSGEISRIAPTTDLVAYYSSKYRHLFPPEVRRTIAPLHEIENCLIKTRFAALAGIGGRAPLAVAEPDDVAGACRWAAATGYPVILKPKSHLGVGFVERGTVVRNEQELRKRFRAYPIAPGHEPFIRAWPGLRWPLIQRYVASARERVYSVSGIKDADTGIVAATVSYKARQWPPDVGISTLQIACEDRRILAAGIEVVDRVLSRGIFEIELLAEDDRLYAIDLNPRAFGFIALDIARGVDLPSLWYRSTFEPLPAGASPRASAVLEARRDLRVAPGSKKSVSMLGDWSDPLPALVSRVSELRHPRGLLRSLFAGKS